MTEADRRDLLQALAGILERVVAMAINCQGYLRVQCPLESGEGVELRAELRDMFAAVRSVRILAISLGLIEKEEPR